MKFLRIYFAIMMVIPVLYRVAGAQEMSEEKWVFDPSRVRRDPFLPLETESKEEEANVLKRYDVNQIQLVAILTGAGAPQAMVTVPGGGTHILQERDELGRHNGRVHKITSTEVIVKESFKDFKGRMKTSFTSLVLAD